jgi:Fe-S oxidoreductase
LPTFKGKAIVHGHCHHKAVMKLNCDRQVLEKAGVDFTVLDSGCCGMAGYFGYIKGKQYDVSVKAGERVLLPAVRKAGDQTIIIADGFSCREQIEQKTHRKALHLAQVLQLALKQGASPGNYHEALKLRNPHKTRNAVLYSTAFAAALLVTLFVKKKYR